MDNVIGELTICFSAENRFAITSALFETTKRCPKKELKGKATKLAEEYSKEISSKEDFVQEINHITMVHKANFSRKQLGALELSGAHPASKKGADTIPTFFQTWGAKSPHTPLTSFFLQIA